MSSLAYSMLPTEKHYSVQEVATMWGVTQQTVRNIFYGEEGVIHLHAPLRPLMKKSKRRPKVTLRIPESVLHRVHNRLSSSVGIVRILKKGHSSVE